VSNSSFKDLLSGSTEEGLRRSEERLGAIARGLWIPEGLSDAELAAISSGLAVPERSGRPSPQEAPPAPIDFIETLVVLGDYLEPSETPGGTAEAMAQQIVSSQNPRTLLIQLAFLGHLYATPGGANRLRHSYKDALRPDLGERFEEAMRQGEATTGLTHLVSRQGILAAIRAVLAAPTWGEEGLEEPNLDAAILLVHAVSAHLSEVLGGGPTAGRKIGEIPADLFMEMVRNFLFNERDAAESVIDRALRLWDDIAPGFEQVELRRPPRELLEEALGMRFEDFFFLGALLWWHAKLRSPLAQEGPRMTMPDGLPGLGMDRALVDKFLDQVAAPPEWFAHRSRDSTTDYDFLAFQAKPVVRFDGQLLVLDERYLLQKFTTTGLFWAVHDNERDRHRDVDRVRWNMAHGEMLEELVVERVHEMAPALPGEVPGRTFYSERSMKGAYPGKRVADAAVDYDGRYFLIFEVTGGQPVVGTRVAGDPDKFKEDTEKLVLEEAEQLHAFCETLLDDEEPLTGHQAPAGRRLVPIIVVGGGYPSDALSRGHVGDVLAEKGWLEEPTIEPLCVLDLTEAEILESLHETHRNLAEILARWKRSGLRNVGFKNFVLREVDPELPTPSRIKLRVEPVLKAALDRVRSES